MRQQRRPVMMALLTMLLVSCTLAPPKNAAIEVDEPNQSLPLDVEDADATEDTADSATEAKETSAPEPLIEDSNDSKQVDDGDSAELAGAELADIELASGERLLPVDEASEDDSFIAFRTELMAAIDNRDTDFLLGIVSPDIHIGFGRAAGIEDFKQRWQLEDPDSEFWAQLDAVLALGGEFQSDFAEAEDALPTFIAPYVFNTFPGRDYNPFGYAAVVADDVVLRAEPDIQSAAIAMLSYHIVKIDRAGSIEIEPGSYEYAWYKVATTEGEEGYVAGQYVRSPIDYRAFFAKESGQWMMTTFLAGD